MMRGRTPATGEDQANSSSDADSIPKTDITSGVSLSLGQYLAEFWLGTPPQKLLLILDTGSDLVWVQCYACHKCAFPTGPLFIPTKSSSFSEVLCSSNECFLVPAPSHDFCDSHSPTSCRYLYRYTDRSQTNGLLGREIITLNSSSGRCVQFSSIVFGCGMRNAGSFNGSGGVLGLGQGDISFSSQIIHSYSKFSYCLGEYLRSNSSSSLLLLGDGEYQDFSFHYTPFVKNVLSPTFYYVRVEQVSVGKEVLAIPSLVWEVDLLGNGGTIFDSGSTLSFFRMPAYLTILNAFQRAVHYPRAHSFQGLDLCVNLSTIAQPVFPAFTITFQGNAVFQPPSSNYFIEVAEDIQCLALQGVDSPFALNTVGNLLQQNFYIQFDRGNSQLGFAPGDCTAM